MKKLVIFDLDGTLAESKAAIDEEMSSILSNLLSVARVAIISGGDWPQFQKQVLAHLPYTNLQNYLSSLLAERNITTMTMAGNNCTLKISHKKKKN